jgi:predicted lactoylglutathione lyase
MPGSVPVASRSSDRHRQAHHGPVHFACRQDRAAVQAFHAAALQAGGKTTALLVRPHYHENYYGAFVFDPDGHNIEAVCHLKE